MLAKLVRTLPEGPQWEYELKLDGYRLQAIKHADSVRLYYRRGNDFTKLFAPIAASVLKIHSTSFVLDGEAVAVDPQGKPSFQVLQNRASLPPGWNLLFYAFDLIHLNGKDLKDRPLSERRELLSKLPGDSGVLISQSLPGTLTQIIAAVKQHALEGVVAKRLDSKYHPGRRSDLWLKLPLKPKQEFVIGAYRLDGKRLELILVGYFEKGKLRVTMRDRTSAITALPEGNRNDPFIKNSKHVDSSLYRPGICAERQRPAEQRAGRLRQS